MNDINALKKIPAQKAWLTIGSFDGVHRGHQALINDLHKQARKNNCISIVITFFPNPYVFFHPEVKTFYLTLQDEKEEILKELGIDHVITLAFNQKFAQQSSNEFLENLNNSINIDTIWVGHDFTFGKNRSGSIKTLDNLREQFPFSIKLFPTVLDSDQRISSSRIRHLIMEGNIIGANHLLGRNYSISSTIINGDRRGRTIGFPTANLEIPDKKIIPARGVYATQVIIDGKTYASMTSVGYNPTFSDDKNQTRIETYILDFNHQIYGQTIKLEFLDFMRPELKFDSAENLVEQLEKDKLVRKGYNQ